MTKGERIKILREAANMSQEELAQKMNTTKQAIYKYEKNIVTNIPSDKIELLAEILRTTPEYILGWKPTNIESNPIAVANVHADIVMDDDFVDLYEDYRLLDSSARKVVKDLVRTLADKK